MGGLFELRFNRSKVPLKRPGWREIFEVYGDNCGECRGRMILPPDYKQLKKIVTSQFRGSNKLGEFSRALEYLKFTYGHVKPRLLGGEETIDNLVGEHFWCNKEKKTRLHLPKEKILWMRNYAGIYVPELLGYLEK